MSLRPVQGVEWGKYRMSLRPVGKNRMSLRPVQGVEWAKNRMSLWPVQGVEWAKKQNVTEASAMG